MTATFVDMTGRERPIADVDGGFASGQKPLLLKGNSNGTLAARIMLFKGNDMV